MSQIHSHREPLRISLIQTDPAWEDITVNLERLDKILSPLAGKTDLVILPEMFSTGFTMNAVSLAETMDGMTIRWMQRQSENIGAAITGSTIIHAGGKYRNRLLWISPGQSPAWYDKRHLFRMGEEHRAYARGMDRVITRHEGWSFHPLICYDLRFPVWARNRNDYDVLVYVANWPAPRQQVWKTLLVARAIENQCYVAGVNRTGTDGRGIDHQGGSMLISPKGELLSSIGEEETVETVAVSYRELADFREKFPVHLDADPFEIFP